MRKAHQPDSMPGYKLPVYQYRRPPELASRGVRTVVLDEDNTVGAAPLLGARARQRGQAFDGQLLS